MIGRYLVGRCVILLAGEAGARSGEQPAFNDEHQSVTAGDYLLIAVDWGLTKHKACLKRGPLTRTIHVSSRIVPAA